MRSLIVGMTAGIVAAMPFVVRAEQKSVPAGTTVTVAAADVAAWASADIDIGAGATLCFSEPTADATFTGNITGSGNFVAKFASSSVRPQVFIMQGNATGFTGAFFYTNVYLYAKSPQAVGNAPITIRMGYTGSTSLRSQFYGSAAGQPDYVYQNPLDIYVQINASALTVNERAVLAGNVLHRYGAINGPGKITGNISTTSNALFFMNELHVEGSVSSEYPDGTKLTNNNGIFYLKGKTEGVTTFHAYGCYKPVYFEGDDLFGEDVVLQMGVGSGGGTGGLSGRIDLNGHSQVFKRVYFTANDSVPGELRNIGGIDNTGAPATITFANHDVGKWFYGCLDGHLSLSVAGSGLFGCAGPTNTMDGTLTHAGGGGNIAMGGAWPRLRRIESINGGIVDIRATAKLNPKLNIIDIDSSSKIKVATDLTVYVRRLRIDGVDVPVGSYNRYTSGPTSGRFESSGGGTIVVTGVPGSMLIVE